MMAGICISLGNVGHKAAPDMCNQGVPGQMQMATVRHLCVEKEPRCGPLLRFS